MKTSIDFEAIILGGDHHNTLSAIRCLGKSDINFRVVIHTDITKKSNICVIKSKYEKNNSYIVKDNETAILEWLINYNTESNKKVVLLPCSDLSAYTIDKYYDNLNNKYICPGFAKKPGMVCNLMDKFEQKRFAEKNDMLMAKTWKIEKVGKSFFIPDDIIFPCIIKPLKSIDGSKGDITIVKSINDFEIILNELLKKGYKKLLIQEFIIKDYELCAFGCITLKSREIIGGVIRKLREYPYGGGGSMTYAQFTFDEHILEVVNKTIDSIVKEGYSGMYDIEFLVSGDKIYVNEFNFRHSGNGHALINNNIPTQKLWCLDAIGNCILNENKQLNEENFLMDEYADTHYVRDKKISFFKWLYELITTKSFTVFSYRDLSGSFGFYKKRLKDKINRIKN